MANSTVVWNVNTTTTQQQSSDPTMDLANSPLIGIIALVFLGLFVLNRMGLLERAPKISMAQSRKKMVKSITKEYKDYLKSHGVKTNQKLYYGATPIGKIKRVAEVPYSLSWERKKSTKDGKEMVDRKGKPIFEKVKKQGNFIMFLAGNNPLFRFFGFRGEVYVIDSESIIRSEHYIIKSSVPLERYMEIWVSKSRIEISYVEELAWKLNHELLISAVPHMSEQLIFGNPNVAKDGAIKEKESDLDDRKAERRKRTI